MDNFEAKLCVENVKLLDELKKDINIRFEKWGQNHWGAKLTDSDSVGIVYCPNEFSDAKIAHELLHLKIGHIMGHNGYLHLQAALHPPYISRIFTDEVLTHLLNSYEHMKIIDEYRAIEGYSTKGRQNIVSGNS